MENPDPNLIYYGIKITDWLQGIGSVVAIIAGIWAFITLFLRDKAKENQIESLVNLSQQAERQTEQLIYQVEQQRKSTLLLQEHVDIFRNSYELEILNQKERVRQQEILEEQRAVDSQPYFFIFWKGLQYDKDDQLLNFALINNGERGRLVDVIELKGNNVKIQVQESEYIEKGHALRFTISPKQVGLSISVVNTNFELIFEDKDKRQHSQILTAKGRNFSISQPKYLKDLSHNVSK